MSTTANFELPVPTPGLEPPEEISEAISKVRAALIAVDGILQTHATGLAGKAASGHGHEIADISGLADALAAKMAADATFTLAGLTDISGAVAAPGGYVLTKGGGSGFQFMSAAAALGTHGHLMSEVTGLTAALADVDNALDGKLALDGGNVAGNAPALRSSIKVASVIEAKSADYTAVAGDRGKMLVFTSAATLSLTAAATLGGDWPIHVRNESSGDIIIDPDSSETVDGFATVRIPPGYTATIWCDGTSFYTDLPNDWLLVREEIVSTPVAAIAFTGLDPYKDVRVRCSVRPSANAKSMYVRFSLDNGANWLSGAASYANAYIQGNSGPGGSGSAIVGHYNAAQLQTHNHDHLTDSEHLFDFFNFNKSRETFGYTESSGVHNDGTQYAMTRWLHRRFGAEAHNAVLFFWADAANFQAGSYIQLYGRRG